MDKLIVLILSIVMVFGAWQVGGQPNETVARDLATKANVKANVISTSIGEEDMILKSSVDRYISNGINIKYVAPATAVTAYAAAVNVPDTGSSSQSTYRIRLTEKNTDGKVINMVLSRINLGQ